MSVFSSNNSIKVVDGPQRSAQSPRRRSALISRVASLCVTSCVWSAALFALSILLRIRPGELFHLFGHWAHAGDPEELAFFPAAVLVALVTIASLPELFGGGAGKWEIFNNNVNDNNNIDSATRRPVAAASASRQRQQVLLSIRRFAFSLRGLGFFWLGVFGGLLCFNGVLMDGPMERRFMRQYPRGCFRGKSVAITGGNSGVGLHSARWIARWGEADVLYLGTRDAGKCRVAKELILNPEDPDAVCGTDKHVIYSVGTELVTLRPPGRTLFICRGFFVTTCMPSPTRTFGFPYRCGEGSPRSPERVEGGETSSKKKGCQRVGT